jgi:hypothetical protein
MRLSFFICKAFPPGKRRARVVGFDLFAGYFKITDFVSVGITQISFFFIITANSIYDGLKDIAHLLRVVFKSCIARVIFVTSCF